MCLACYIYKHELITAKIILLERICIVQADLPFSDMAMGTYWTEHS